MLYIILLIDQYVNYVIVLLYFTKYYVTIMLMWNDVTELVYYNANIFEY